MFRITGLKRKNTCGSKKDQKMPWDKITLDYVARLQELHFSLNPNKS